MRWIFLAPFVVLSSFCLGQVPDYVPQVGLISWHNLDGNAEASFGPYEGALSGTIPAFNRHGEEAMALRFEDGDHVALGNYAELQGSCEFTVSTWFNADASNEGHNMLWCSGLNHWLLNFTSSDDIVIDTGNYCNQQSTSGNTLQNDEWHHVVTVLSNGLVTVLVDNEIYATLEVNTCMCSHPYTMMLATMDGFPHNFVGSLDEFGTWNRALENWEIEMLYSEVLPSLGCTDETACNYDLNAAIDDGSCDYFTCLCLDGTIWSEELQGCIPATTCPQDLDYDGVVGVNDLMNLLSAFGTPCDPPVAEWTCGDPVSYHGYDYETVLIGEQCWFAENLRTELYQNGDSIILAEETLSWQSNGIPFQCVWQNDLSSIENWGRLYNWWAITDDRSICPTGWTVPNNNQFEILIDFAGGWGTGLITNNTDDSPFVGSNETEWTGVFSGFRSNGGEFSDFENQDHTFWWTSESSDGYFGQAFQISSTFYPVNSGYSKRYGFSVRCVSD